MMAGSSPAAAQINPTLYAEVNYGVLTMCRMLYTLDTGTVASKPVAARWARGIADGHWDALIEHALAWRKDRPALLPDDDRNETLALIQYTLGRCSATKQ